MIRLNCFVRCNEGKEEVVAEAAKTLTAASLKQDGCIAYDVFQSETRPDVKLICETWRDQAALDAHSASDVFVEQVGIMRANSEMKLESFNF